MKINKVTITGADDNTSHAELEAISKEFPFVEWGILFSQSKVGEQRYPTKKWVEKLQDLDLNLSAHFCGWFSREVLENQHYSLISSLHKSFKRIQINCNFKHYDSKIYDYLERLVDNSIVFYNGRSIILQWNKSNEPILSEIVQWVLPKNINFLYDASGGRGTVIKSIEPPIDEYYTGYSGGLNEENIDEVCKLITEKKVSAFKPSKVEFNYSESGVWIDLESGARTNNEFDLHKVKSILQTVKKYIK